MERSTKESLLRDANRNVIPQHYDDKIGKYVAIGIGDLSAIDFRKTTLLRDGNNRVIPNQYYDANLGQWSVSTSQIVGKSAYDIAVEHGYVGSQAEWLDSLRGEGVSLSGKSAYELALATGYVGNIDEWLASLVGPSGIDGKDGVDGRKGDTGALHYDITGATGRQLKIFTTTVPLQKDGVWAVNYASAQFSGILSIQATPIHPDDTAANTPTGASTTSYTTTQATGKVLKGTSAGLLAAMSNIYANAEATQVHVTVIGY